MPTSRSRAPRPVQWVARLFAAPFRGDRPMILAVLASLVVGGLLLAAPAQRYLEARERVEALQVKDEVLTEEIARLEQRIEDLNDPEYIELIAREQQGFVRPGEMVYRIIPPEPDEPEQHDVPARAEPAPEHLPLHERAWRMLESLIDGG